MIEILSAIGIIFIVAGIIKFFSTKNESLSIDVNKKTFQFEKSIPISIGSFKAYQYIGEDEQRFDFYCSIEYDKSDKAIIILIDGRKLGTKMKLDFNNRNSLVKIIDKAIEWEKKANEARLTANKLISSIIADVSFIFDNKTYFSENSEIKFNFYSDSSDNSEAKIFLVSNKFNVGGAIVPPAVIWIENNEFENIKLLLSEENLNSRLQQIAEHNMKVDEILN